MMLVNALESVCDLLLCFSFASLIGVYKESWLPMGSVMALAFFSSLILQKTRGGAPARIICGLIPALGLLTVKNSAELAITVIVLIFYFILTVAGKNEIHYEDYKYWFGIPAIIVCVLFFICLSKWPIRRASVILAAAYLFLGIIVLREKRQGRGADLKLRLLSISEPVAAVLLAVLAGLLVYGALKVSIDFLLLPFAYLFRPLIYLFELLGNLVISRHPEDPTAPATTEAETGNGIQVPEPAPADPEVLADYAKLSLLIRGALILLVLAALVYIFYRFRGMLRHVRAGDADGSDAVRESGQTPVRFFRARRKKHKKASVPSNNEKIREIYREYLYFIRARGIEIVRQTTSEDVMAASGTLAAPEEARQLRALYIRARYHVADEISDEEVEQAEALLNAIKEKISTGKN